MLDFVRTHLVADVIAALGGLVILALLVFAFRTWRQILKSPPSPVKPTPPPPTSDYVHRLLTKDNWATFEQNVPDLIRVVVVAHRVDRPGGQLLDAVVHNLQRRVRYVFLVSHSSAITEVDGWFTVFESFAQGLIREHHLNGAVGAPVEIMKLPYDWDDYPYVFYLQGNLGAQNEEVTTTVAFRGTDQKKGICKTYKEIAPEEAQTLARVLMQGAPGRIEEAMQSVVDSKFESPLPSAQTNAVEIDHTNGRTA